MTRIVRDTSDFATFRLERLLDGAKISNISSYNYNGYAILAATVADSDDIRVAWDCELDLQDKIGACIVPAQDMPAWLSLRWPAFFKKEI